MKDAAFMFDTHYRPRDLGSAISLYCYRIYLSKRNSLEMPRAVSISPSKNAANIRKRLQYIKWFTRIKLPTIRVSKTVNFYQQPVMKQYTNCIVMMMGASVTSL